MTVFPTPGPGELGTRHGCLRLRLACPVLAPAPVSGEPGHPVTVTRPGHLVTDGDQSSTGHQSGNM